jgi:hypothetical protein
MQITVKKRSVRGYANGDMSTVKLIKIFVVLVSFSGSCRPDMETMGVAVRDHDKLVQGSKLFRSTFALVFCSTSGRNFARLHKLANVSDGTGQPLTSYMGKGGKHIRLEERITAFKFLMLGFDRIHPLAYC